MATSDNATTEETRVGHCKADETDVYVGRGDGGRSIINTDPWTRGWLGNPYALSDGYDRDVSIEKFREDFEERLEADGQFRRAVKELSGKTLGCWCQRLGADEPACHGEVIAEWADKLASDD